MSGESPAQGSIKKAAQEIEKGANQALEYIGWGYNASANALLKQYNQSRSDITTYFQKGIDAQQPWADLGLAAAQKYQNTISNPQAGMGDFLNSSAYRLFFDNTNPNATAAERFQSSPGYKWQLNQGEQAIQRGAAANGYLSNPRMLTEMNDYAQGLAQQDYGNYTNLLQGQYNTYLGQLQNGAQLGFQAASNIGNLNAQQGTGLSDLSTGYGQNMTDLNIWSAEQQSNAALAKANAWASRSLVNAAMQAPSAQGAVSGWLGGINK